MRVRMKGDMTGTRNLEPWPPRGGEIDLPDWEGEALCANGMAEEVKGKSEPEPVVETATVEENSEASTPLTTATGPAKRGPGRPRKNA